MKNLFYLLSVILFTACTTDSTRTTTTTTSTHQEEEAPDSANTKIEINTQNDTVQTQRPEEFIWKTEGYSNITPLRAYIDDPDDEAPTNVRDKPNGKIIQELPQFEDYMFMIIGQQNGWFEIEKLRSLADEIEIKNNKGWIHSSVVGGSSRFCCDQGVPIYKYPEAKDEFYIDQIPNERSLKIKKMYFDFILVESINVQGKKIEGWLHHEWICGNPVTTCP